MRDSSQLDLLQEMLMWRRPGGSRSEHKFIARYIEPLGVARDGYGNLIKRIGTAPVLWSCHTDTVHGMGGLQAVERAGDMFGLPDAEKSNCLGADDTAGVWLMCAMIRAKVAGLYVFHREEECGAGGSLHIANKTPALLEGVRYAIALDRKGHDDVITHQFGRCCSEAFAVSLAAGLNTQGLHYRPDPTGMFTDTANYTDAIGECTNLSVGYAGQHTAGEIQDGAHALALLEALCRLDVAELAYARKPGETSGYEKYPFVAGNASGRAYGRSWDDWPDAWDDPVTQAPSDLLSLVRAHPEAAADMLESFGVDKHELQEHIWALGV